MSCLFQGCEESTRLLLEYGADPEMRMVEGWTPAHCPAEAGHVNILKLLIDYGCPMYLGDDSGDTPAQVAQTYGHKLAKKLLDESVKKSV